MKVFLTGGTGFIGQPLTQRLLNRGWEVIALVRETCREAGAALLLVSHDREILSSFPRVASMATINRCTAAAEVSS